MSITSYETLRAEVQRWCARRDSTFTAAFRGFVGLAEDRLYEGAEGETVDPALRSPALRSRAMEASETVTLTAGAASLPDDMLDVRKVHVPGLTPGLSLLPPERFAVLAAQSITGPVPLYASIHAGTISVLPAVDGSVVLDFYRRHPPITDTAQTGPLMAAHGNLYFSACMFEAFSFMGDAELALGHLARLRGQIAGANKTAAGTRTAGKLTIRQRGWVP